MKEIALKSEILDVLQDIRATSFTVDELTEAYLHHRSSLHTSKKAARQFVYRNMQRLMKVGHMERLMAAGGWPRYVLTQKFIRLYKSTPLISPASVEVAVQLQIDPLAGLKERLKVHQAEVLTAMGEMEEYEAICQEMPDLREIAQPRYNESRERCSRLLGRVKALESLLVEEVG
jgi:hypothetical protein